MRDARQVRGREEGGGARSPVRSLQLTGSCTAALLGGVTSSRDRCDGGYRFPGSVGAGAGGAGEVRGGGGCCGPCWGAGGCDRGGVEAAGWLAGAGPDCGGAEDGAEVACRGGCSGGGAAWPS